MPLMKCAEGWKYGDSDKVYKTKGEALKHALVFGEENIKVEIPVEIKKSNVDQQLVFGWANVSMADGEMVVDSHGDTIALAELENAAYAFNLHYRATGEMHLGDVKGELVESFMVTPEKLEKMGLEPNALPLGWWVGFHVDDPELFAKVKSGEYRAFSIQGTAKRVK